MVGTGIWLGVQHLGYPEFGEIRRVAQRTLDQRRIVINNLAIRRATAELKVARDYPQVCRVLVAAFSSSDFDAFEVNIKLLLSEYSSLHNQDSIPISHGEVHFRWNRPGILLLPGTTPAWGLTLDLHTSSNRRRGSMCVHRLYHEHALQLDVNLLISEFPDALADALDRVMGPAIGMAPQPNEGKGLLEAQAG